MQIFNATCAHHETNHRLKALTLSVDRERVLLWAPDVMSPHTSLGLIGKRNKVTSLSSIGPLSVYVVKACYSQPYTACIIKTDLASAVQDCNLW